MVPHDPGVVTNDSPPAAKVAFYLREFAARQDVYAYYWENQRKGTRNWSPKLRDQYGKGPIWERGPLPLTTDVIAAHLNPNFDLFIGLYPLLPDSTCWWLAADFDGAQAMLDAHAYVKAASSLRVPCGLEISQSGRGAHVWTFFEAPVPAAEARAMGTAAGQLRPAVPKPGHGASHVRSARKPDRGASERTTQEGTRHHAVYRFGDVGTIRRSMGILVEQA
ncbi:MAG: hypothetical protein LBG99_09295 [Propionibacteriaceae bacterium]|nr:hypothetical protein [Propionibacteriaceae bacterium]